MVDENITDRSQVDKRDVDYARMVSFDKNITLSFLTNLAVISMAIYC